MVFFVIFFANLYYFVSVKQPLKFFAGQQRPPVAKFMPPLSVELAQILLAHPRPVKLARLLHNFLVYRDCIVGIVLAWLAVCVSM